MTLMLWLHGNEFSPEGASYKLQRQQAKNNQWNFRDLSSLCVKLALAGFYSWKKQRINVLKKLPADVICKRFLYLKRS